MERQTDRHFLIIMEIEMEIEKVIFTIWSQYTISYHTKYTCSFYQFNVGNM